MINEKNGEMGFKRNAFLKTFLDSVVWRQKQFSDGVGYDWIDSLKDLVNKKVSNDMFLNAKYTFPFQTPLSKEEYYYRQIFEDHFPSNASASTVPSVPSVACSSPVALSWDKSFKKDE